jgi:hypothetical protein
VFEVVVLRGKPLAFAASIERVAKMAMNEVLVIDMLKLVVLCLLLWVVTVLCSVRDARDFLEGINFSTFGGRMEE